MTDNVLITFVKSTPPVTRALCGIVASLIFISVIDLLKPYQMSYSWYHLKDLQIHRIFTAPFSFGMLSVENLMHVVFLYRYSSLLEDSYFHKSDYIWVLFITSLFLLVNASFIFTPHLGPSLSCTITYLWTRKNPRAFVQAYGFLTFYAFYLPFLLPLYTLISEKTIHLEEFNGIVVGQLVYYFKDVYPKFGRDFFRTPCLLHRLCNEIQDCCKEKNTSFDIGRNSQSNQTTNKEMVEVKNMDDSISEVINNKIMENNTSNMVQTNTTNEIDEFEKNSSNYESWNSSSCETEEHPKPEESNHSTEEKSTISSNDPLSDVSSEFKNSEKENIDFQMHAKMRDLETESDASASTSSVFPSLGNYINSKLTKYIKNSVADISNEFVTDKVIDNNDSLEGLNTEFDDDEHDFESDNSFEELDYNEVVKVEASSPSIDQEVKSCDGKDDRHKNIELPQHENETTEEASSESSRSNSNRFVENDERSYSKSEESNMEFQSFSEEDSNEYFSDNNVEEECSNEISRDSDEDWDSS